MYGTSRNLERAPSCCRLTKGNRKFRGARSEMGATSIVTSASSQQNKFYIDVSLPKIPISDAHLTKILPTFALNASHRVRFTEIFAS